MKINRWFSAAAPARFLASLILCVGAMSCTHDVQQQQSPQTLSQPDKPFLEWVKPHLVRVEGGALKKADPATLAKVKYLAVYYSASWCPPCRIFTPELVKFYNAIKPSHPDFELVFVSGDIDEETMRKYMIDEKMTWPAVAQAEAQNPNALQYDPQGGLPVLVLIDTSSGRVISDTFRGDEYLGPEKVVADIRKVLGAGS